MTTTGNAPEVTREKLTTLVLQSGSVLVGDPRAPIENGARVIVTLWDGRQFDGHACVPSAKGVTYKVRLSTGGILRRMRRHTLARVIQEIPRTNQTSRG